MKTPAFVHAELWKVLSDIYASVDEIVQALVDILESFLIHLEATALKSSS
jgi:hypothetical protein